MTAAVVPFDRARHEKRIRELEAEVARLRNIIDDDRLIIRELQEDYELATATLHRVMAAKKLEAL